jgi:hypothetical protein
MRAPANSFEVDARIICQIKGEALDGRIAPMDFSCELFDEPAPGFLRHIGMGEEGILLFVGHEQVFIPVSELWAVADAAVASLPGRFVVPEKRASSPAVRSGEPILSAKILHITSAGSIAIAVHLPVHEAFAIAEPEALHRTIFGRHGVSVKVGETQIYIALADLLKLAEAAVPALRPSAGCGLTKIDA